MEKNCNHKKINYMQSLWKTIYPLIKINVHITESHNSIPTYIPIRMFIEILFIKVKGIENNTTVHREKSGYTHCIIFPLECSRAVKRNKRQLNVIIWYTSQEQCKPQSTLQKMYTEWFHLYKIPEQAKWYHLCRNINRYKQ